MGNCAKRYEVHLLSYLAVGVLIMGCQTRSPGQNASTAQAPLSTLQGGETGRIFYRSSDPPHYRNLIDGLANDPPQTVFGDLVIPLGATDPVPVIIFMHGSSGWSPTHERYLNAFQKMGVATFRPDSFTPRDVASTVGRQRLVHRAKMMADAYHALTLLRTHPRLDPHRIGLMGASKGGGVALFTAWEFWTQPALPGPERFALHIPLYPNCSTTFEVNQLSGAHSGPKRAAKRAAMQDVKAFVARVFDLPEPPPRSR